MHPVLFEIFGVPVSSFGVLMSCGFLVGTWITTIRMREEGLDPDLWGVMLLCVLVGGVAGAKLYFAADTALRSGAGWLPLLGAASGMTWYGGLLGGFLGAALGARLCRISLKVFADCVCIGLAVGQAIGRVGCLLVGDDYGRPTDAPWGVAFPHGSPPTSVPVHPTQVYEILWLLPVALLLWRRRRASPFLCGEYLALHGLGRLVIEHWRVNPELALGLSQAQWFALGLIAYAAATLGYYRRRTRIEGGPGVRVRRWLR
ncbi:MAG: prolipoprotein diacylglyceryl transferase [Deltaproteobacteria bacterium]|nr:MAG: prolipoprotein diacylglyceryl transferase [Deltaproteobacteria bacterium]